MTLSIPSADVYAVDVPDVNDVSATFVYNFFTTDESVNDRSGTSYINIDDESKFQARQLKRLPRYISLAWTAPTLKLNSRVSFPGRPELTAKDLDPPIDVNISSNLDKVVSEDALTNGEMINVLLQDAELNDRSFNIVSSSLLVGSDLSTRDTSVDAFRAAFQLADDVENVDASYLYTSLSNKSKGQNLRFFSPDGSRLRQTTLDPLRKLSTNIQLNSKVAPSILGAAADTHSLNSITDLQRVFSSLKLSNSATSQATPPSLSDVVVPYVDINAINSSMNVSSVSHVGYVIEKQEVVQDGTIINHEPIVIDGKSVSSIVDPNVKYGSLYLYQVKAVYRFSVQANEVVDGTPATVGVLVSSQPNRVFVRTVEYAPPPPPADLAVKWDYISDRPVVTWSFPTNPQRDIKHFQVFRRRTVDEPFELVKHYDFDDSVVREELREKIDAGLISKSINPTLRWIDREFDRLKSDRMIYAVGSVDAHGFVSTYSMQLLVWFDNFKNKLNVEIVSHAGAPKAYPNFFLEADAVKETVHIEGQAEKKVEIIFNPSFYELAYDDGTVDRSFLPFNRGGEYVFQFTNIENAGSSQVKVNINDARTPPASTAKVIVGTNKAISSFLPKVKLPFSK